MREPGEAAKPVTQTGNDILNALRTSMGHTAPTPVPAVEEPSAPNTEVDTVEDVLDLGDVPTQDLSKFSFYKVPTRSLASFIDEDMFTKIRPYKGKAKGFIEEAVMLIAHEHSAVLVAVEAMVKRRNHFGGSTLSARIDRSVWDVFMHNFKKLKVPGLTISLYLGGIVLLYAKHKKLVK